MKKNQLFFLIMICTFFVQCRQSQPETNGNTATDEIPEFSLPEWAKDATIYELNIRNFSPNGDIDGVISQLPRLRKMGIDMIWLMPVHPISMTKRKATPELNVSDIPAGEDISQYKGSPYAVSDYKAINPDYGTMSDFSKLIAEAHQLDLKVIIDWVPNHTGWDHSWIKTHPEYYTKDSLGNIIDPIDYNTGKSWGWTDVADLNYDNQEMRDAMAEEMKFWLKDVDIDGFRVDVAHGIPQDFWNELMPKLRSVKSDIFLLAESEVPSHRNEETFHASYAWSFHHLINDIAKTEKKASDIVEWHKNDRNQFHKGFNMHFTSNHDENTWAGTEFERLGDGHKAFAVLTATLDGMPLIYNGQEEPLKKRLEFFVQDPIPFKNYEYQEFYTDLCSLKHSNEALWNGTYGGEPSFIYADDQMIAYRRIKDLNEVVVIINLSNKPADAPISVDDNDYSELNGKEITRNGAGNITLDPWSYYIFSNKK